MTKTSVAKASRIDAEESVKINLVQFKGEFFPLEEVDFKTLKEYGVVTFRIKPATFDILTRTLLRGKKIVFHKWKDVFPHIIEQFVASLPNDAECSRDTNIILVAVRKSDEQAYHKSSAVLSHYLGRYGVKISVQNKDRGDWWLSRIECQANADIVPSGYFSSPEQLNTPIENVLYLSAHCRLRFSRVAWPDGTPVLKLTFEEASGPQFTASFTRAFPTKFISPQSAQEMAYFFADLADATQPKPVPRTRYGD